MLLFMLAIAPALYWIVGRAIMGGRAAANLLLGVGIMGLVVELTYMLGIAYAVMVPLAVVGALMLIIRGEYGKQNSTIVAELGELYILYVAALVPVLLTPFPGLGIWGGDWAGMYDIGQQMLHFAPLPAESLGRPPLAGAIAVPLWLLRVGLAPFQIVSAVVAAGLLQVVLDTVRAQVGMQRLGLMLLPMAGSALFLHNVEAGWIKPLVAGLIVASYGFLTRQHGARDRVLGALCFGLALAAHFSAILFSPLLLAPIFALRGGPAASLSHRLNYIATVVATISLVFAPMELWTIWQHGLKAILAASPSLAMREPGVSIFTNTILVLTTTFVGWGVGEDAIRLLVNGLAAIPKNSYWLITGWIAVMAGTLLGTVLPFAPLQRRLMPLFARADPLMLLTAAFAIIGNAVLSPYNSPWGTAQNGLMPLQVLMLAYFLLPALAKANALEQRWVGHLTLALCTLPFVFVAAAVTVSLETLDSVRRVFAESPEDWATLVLPKGLVPLSMELFPLTVAVGLAATAVGGWLYYRGVRESLSRPVER